MILSIWSDKGGTGKSLLAAMAASHPWSSTGLPVVVVDLDPQGDAAGWASRAGIPFHRPQSPEKAAEVIQSLDDWMVIVDCPPGRLKDNRLAGVGVLLSDALLIPAGSGRPDLDALGRGIKALEELDQRGAPLKAGVVLNHFRETIRNRVVEEGLRLAKLAYLGHLGERATYPDWFAEGRDMTGLNGAAAFEAKTLWARIDSWVHAS